MNVVSIITPTTGKKSLYRLIDSIRKQNVPYEHILLWDDKREGDFLYPDHDLKTKNPYDMEDQNTTCLVFKGSMVYGKAYGSALRSIGLLSARGDYVTFADDDIYWDDNHLQSMLASLNNREWAYCRRKIYDQAGNCIGVDNFESVGDSPDRKVPYEMVDNNCMIFSRRFGSSGACLYRETKDYNDDRLFYGFLKKYAGTPGITKIATVNQVCPLRLEAMFKQHCTR